MSCNTPKDKEVFLFNPITGQFDMALKFNADRIVTHSLNASGRPLVLFDPVLGVYEDLSHLVVTDKNGNVVVNG